MKSVVTPSGLFLVVQVNWPRKRAYSPTANCSSMAKSALVRPHDFCRAIRLSAPWTPFDPGPFHTSPVGSMKKTSLA